MSAPYVTRRAINATEEVLEEDASLDGALSTAYGWTAELDGYPSTGEHVQMTRSGHTFAAAVVALEAAIAENGWTVKERGTR